MRLIIFGTIEENTVVALEPNLQTGAGQNVSAPFVSTTLVLAI